MCMQMFACLSITRSTDRDATDEGADDGAGIAIDLLQSHTLIPF